MRNRITLILTLSLLLSSCEFTINTNNSKNVDLGKMPKVESKTFENLYVADEKICESKELPITRFAIEYPNGYDVETPNDKENHIVMKKTIENIVVEELSIGNSTITLKNKNLTLTLIENVADNLKKQFPEMEILTVGKKEFNGEMNYLFEGKVDYSDFIEQGYNGVYKIMFVIPLPKENEELNAVMISMIANEQSEIKTFADFTNKGMIGKVYKTFRYIE
ncbi:hypothetical protein BWZ20_00280 [Winogradskyella sp. J14-2]|uniref:hypothetical protein n=1 Tax=Winogradskyella sp. J14-2 TaxID=1936080 RepID=UPI0009727A25|nr:hypothetical protein [Winogradskyella sp. J14-2]APY06795.1 hypothetical protein BWZ20_00100 [Winogradskyella sp. J14-2]APY06824.1 hypothetical protein BWZ20_00280 [Winogradskyella sp. J14-2]